MTRALFAATVLLVHAVGAAAQERAVAPSTIDARAALAWRTTTTPHDVPSTAVSRAAAQRAERSVGAAMMSTGKWITLGVAAASAVYGFSESRRADDLYDELERDCQADPELCRQRTDRGAYLDPDFEKRYQDVLDIDDRTRQALFVTQASLLASAVLFVLDMSGDDTRPDVPYEPPTRLKILPSGMGALRLEARYSIDELVNW